MSKKHVAPALLYAPLMLFSAAVQSSSPQSVVTVNADVIGQQASRDSVEKVYERAATIGRQRHAPVKSFGMPYITDAELYALPEADLKMYAAADFLGFYTINVYNFADVCRVEGISLATYARAFRTKHAAEFARAEKITKGSMFSAEKMAAMTAATREVLETSIRHQMLDLAAALHKTTVADGCAYVAANVVDVKSTPSYAERDPQLESVLMSDEAPIKRPGSLPASNPYLSKPINRHRATHDESTETSQ
jgi:hypothetical protein